MSFKDKVFAVAQFILYTVAVVIIVGVILSTGFNVLGV
jgi:hypothetical protein